MSVIKGRKMVLALPWGENACVTRMWLKGFSRYAQASKWTMEVMPSIDRRGMLRAVREMIRFFKPDGIVAACYDELQDGLIGDIPHVWMDPPLGHVVAGDSYVVHDGDTAVELALKELTRLGVPHFAAVGDHPSRAWSGRRLAEFRRRVRGQGTFDELELTKQNLDFLLSKDKVSRVRQIEPWLKRLPKPCGVFAVCDRIGADVISAAIRLGLRIPEDVAVIGVDNDEDICLMTTPPLTSIATDWEKGGFMCGEVLDRCMGNPNGPPMRKTFGELGVIRRASTSPSPIRVDPRVANASLYIREHACEGIGVDDVVRNMGCSRRLAMMKYLAATGRSIFAEIREAQFEKVLVYLSRRDIQIGAIADRCGWKSPTALRAYFEKRLGMSMREWRNRNAAS